MQKIFFVLLCALPSWVSTLAHAEVKLLGQRWVTEYDARGSLLTISDLSFPDWSGTYWIGHLENSRNQKKSSSSSLLASQIFSSDLSDDPSIDPKSLSALRTHFLSQSYQEKANPALPERWWKSVHWKNRAPALVDEAPSQFVLSDLQLPASSNPSVQTILDSIHFIRNESEGYDIVWISAQNFTKTPPQLLVDLTEVKFGLKEALTWDGISKAIGFLLDVVPEPITKALAKTAINRYFHFHNLVMRAHQQMLLEALTNPEITARLSDPEIQQAIAALVYSDTTLLTSWKWFWNSPSHQWKQQLYQERNRQFQSENWLSGASVSVQRFAPNFGFSTDHWYAFGSSLFSSRSGPLAILDFADPNEILQHRMAAEAAATMVEFGSNFVPIIGGLVSGLYESIVGAREDQHRLWDAKLTSELEISSEQWVRELEQLSVQRFNPLMPSREEYLKLISDRKRNLGL